MKHVATTAEEITILTTYSYGLATAPNRRGELETFALDEAKDMGSEDIPKVIKAFNRVLKDVYNDAEELTRQILREIVFRLDRSPNPYAQTSCVFLSWAMQTYPDVH